jgi:3-keto-5-aminohexanoate cleavage enzyme
MKKILISVAPVAHVGTTIPDGINNPLTPEDVAYDALECFKRGASMVHLHVRNNKGEQIADLSYFSQTIDMIRQQSDIIIQGSTGGVAELSLEERCVSLNDPRVEMGSLNMGSTNFGEGVYINTLPDIRYWAKKMQENNVIPELEIFDLSMVGSSLKIFREGLISTPLSFNFCLGFENSTQATADNLFYLKSSIPENSHWGFIHENMEDFSLLVAAASMGASVLRVGYEDSFYYAKGKSARSNAELVERLVDIIGKLDYEPMNPAEARKLLNIPAL